MSKCTMYLIFTAFIPTLLLYSTESMSWDIGNNTATYSTTLASINSGNSSDFSLSQFNADNAVANGEAAGGTYTLTKVVIEISGTISGDFIYTTYTANGGTVTSSSLASTTGFTMAVGGGSAFDSFSLTDVSKTAPLVLSGITQVTHHYDEVASSGGSATITDDLSAFVGSDKVSGTVSLDAALTSTVTGSMSAQVDAYGSPTVSITYFYDAVPEPTSLALLGLGCVAVLARRRFRKTPEI